MVVLLCNVVIVGNTCAVFGAGADVVAGCIRNDVADMVVAGQTVGQVLELALLPRLWL